MTFKELKDNLTFDNCFKAGRFLKTHTYKGHITAKVFFDFQAMNKESILVDINGFLVPFFIDFTQSNCDVEPVIIKLANINDIEEAKKLAGLEFYIPRKDIPDIDEYLTDFENFVVGFELISSENNFAGRIIDFAESKNPLFLIETDDNENEIMLPVNALEIKKVDYIQQKIFCSFPESLLQ